jgi:hypothetical protein
MGLRNSSTSRPDHSILLLPIPYRVLLSCACIRGVSVPFELYTTVHTIAQYEACNSLIYKDKQVRRKWLSDCDRDGIPSCCWTIDEPEKNRNEK